MNKKQWCNIAGTLEVVALCISMSYGAPQPAVSTPPNTPAAAETGKPMPEYKSYIYYGERYRDPFVPLVGPDSQFSSSSNERPVQLGSLTVKGIVQDAKGRMALLSSGASSYILRGGRLYDAQNRPIKQISGIIKAESVVLIGSDRTVREVRLSKLGTL